MTLYAAIDLHSDNGVLSVIDEQDHVVFERMPPATTPTVSLLGLLRLSR